MDDTDGLLIGLCLLGLSAVMLLLCHAIKSLQEDVDLLRVTAAVPEIERRT